LDGEIENNTIWDDWREYQNSNQRKSRLLWTEEAHAMVRLRMLKIIRSEETS
jgi:hypothetical protein